LTRRWPTANGKVFRTWPSCTACSPSKRRNVASGASNTASAKPASATAARWKTSTGSSTRNVASGASNTVCAKPAPTIDRTRIEELASGEFVRRGENLVQVGQSGVGKSHLIQGIGRRLCVAGYRVRYTTSADLVKHLAASRADDTLARRLRDYARFDLLIIDEFGFEKLERLDCPQAANLFYKVIEARSPRRSTALVTNVAFEAWTEYLGDPPLAMAFLDRLVDGALVLKLEGKSYRAHRARRLDAKSAASDG
jgi:DNA replication protein DnaC